MSSVSPLVMSGDAVVTSAAPAVQMDLPASDFEIRGIEIVTVNADGDQINRPVSAYATSVSQGGRYVAFTSHAANLLPGLDLSSRDEFDVLDGGPGTDTDTDTAVMRLDVDIEYDLDDDGSSSIRVDRLMPDEATANVQST